MRKLIATINMTLDAFCDHTAVDGGEAIHEYFTDLVNNSGGFVYGRTTYQLMESYWPTVVKNPTGKKSMDDFATAIDNVPKIVFSRTLKEVGWRNVKLATKGVKEEIAELKQQPGNDLMVGSPSLIVQCMNLGLLDEYRLVIHPVVAGSGLPLFKGIQERSVLKLIKAKTLKNSGAVVMYYESGKA